VIRNPGPSAVTREVSFNKEGVGYTSLRTFHNSIDRVRDGVRDVSLGGRCFMDKDNVLTWTDALFDVKCNS